MSSHHPDPDPHAHAPSDTETYDHLSQNDNSSPSPSPSPPSTSSSPLILYKPPTIWGLLRGAVINLFLPFVNGLMLGFGELVANEMAFRLGWSGTKIFPSHRGESRRVGPGVEMRAAPVERRRRSGEELDMYTALE
ncbi:TOM13-domain-containing protein [Westerdykella ornata]|uniref:TOM13-domain-containing protein n=1 Tax=Westerdykella ornata TaxID=318751 RepID=A0A6A6JUU6_WESOR|nr:TOM13-domain-containing protein [Westerdykella ornata]KAF2279994.1 TOM13-domain-containing protein [Westerdykella ornata]